MGKVMSVVGRQVQRFNVENRAQKVISQAKPKPAPKFESNLRDLERVLKEHPEIVQEQSRKNVHLDENLRRVYVTSKDVAVGDNASQTQDPDKPLPINRSSVEEYEFGHLEPRAITKGRCTLRQAVQFIANHQTDPQQWTSAKIAEHYNMKEPLVVNILEHFKSFEVHLPDKNLQRRRLLTRATDTSKQIE
ncbi:protein NDUFAF4 homolog isoform X2 [Anopheles nili]|uniref:protein NDUFAF4 homolog isoform X2 n=1 Tax=Anopheles nili TaxID=185578 RepID=UPI00237B806D|nr:protein NDUFAF4 homolog isoform X2 [Anopheles nili]